MFAKEEGSTAHGCTALKSHIFFESKDTSFHALLDFLVAYFRSKHKSWKGLIQTESCSCKKQMQSQNKTFTAEFLLFLLIRNNREAIKGRSQQFQTFRKNVWPLSPQMCNHKGMLADRSSFRASVRSFSSRFPTPSPGLQPLAFFSCSQHMNAPQRVMLSQKTQCHFSQQSSTQTLK